MSFAQVWSIWDNLSLSPSTVKFINTLCSCPTPTTYLYTFFVAQRVYSKYDPFLSWTCRKHFQHQYPNRNGVCQTVEISWQCWQYIWVDRSSLVMNNLLVTSVVLGDVLCILFYCCYWLLLLLLLFLCLCLCCEMIVIVIKNSQRAERVPSI